jgi:hypothetical protein
LIRSSTSPVSRAYPRGIETDIDTDEELTELAMAAEVDPPIEPGAPSFYELTADDDADPLLPTWYMPAPMAGATSLRGWRRKAALVVVIAFLLILACGLCSTYGAVVAA